MEYFLKLNPTLYLMYTDKEDKKNVTCTFGKALRVRLLKRELQL